MLGASPQLNEVCYGCSLWDRPAGNDTAGFYRGKAIVKSVQRHAGVCIPRVGF